MYIKTDGPIPEGCSYITAGRVYEATPSDGPHYYGITDDNGAARDVGLLLRCVCTVCRPGWHFCDRYGNPVPAPWEEASKPQACSKECELDPDWPVCGLEFRDDGSGICGNRNSQGMPCGHLESCHKQVNYRAHAEALAEALEMMVEMVEFGGFGKAAAMDTARAALAAFDQDGGG